MYPTVDKSFEEMANDISSKKNFNYCGAYELLNHDELKKKCFLPRRNKSSNHNQEEEKAPKKKKKTKIGKLRSINKIISRDHELNEKGSKIGRISGDHLARLNRINDKMNISEQK